MPIRRNLKPSALLIASILGYLPELRAENLAFGVDVGVGESDNVRLVPAHAISQTLAVVDLDFAVQEQKPWWDLAAKGDFSYLDFLQGAYKTELIGRFDGLAHLVLIRDRLTWIFRDDFGQAAIDPFAATTPANLENVNFVTTGPDVSLRVGTIGFLDVSARYARTQYEVSPFDNDRAVGTFALGRPSSALSELSVTGTSEHVVFQNTVANTDFNRYSLYGHYELQGARTEIIANVGAIQVAQGINAAREPLAKLQLGRRLTEAANLTLTAGQTITDAGASFSDLQSGAIGVIGNAPASLTSANYRVTYASAAWKYVRNRTTFNLSGDWEKDAYIGVPLLDLKRETYELNVERHLSRAVTVQLLGRLYETHYPREDFDGTDGQIGARLTLREGRGLEFRLEYNHNARIVSGIGNGYQENRVFLMVGYRPKPAFAPIYNPGRIGRPVFNP